MFLQALSFSSQRGEKDRAVNDRLIRYKIMFL